MARLPVPGSDDGTWGSILNDFLDVEHATDGSLRNVARPADLNALQKTADKGQPGGYAALDASGLVDTSQLPSATDATASNKGIVQLAGDLGGTASSPTVPGLAGKLAASNNLSDVASAGAARTNLGLGNVDDTADIDKPISTATQTALDLKAPLDSPALTGTPTLNGSPMNATGADGKTVLSGTVDPTGSDGVDGDFWINTATNHIFGPKASGAWPTGVSLIGPAGAAGSAILSGSTPPGPNDGSTGDYWLDKTTSMLYGPRSSGTGRNTIGVLQKSHNTGFTTAPATTSTLILAVAFGNTGSASSPTGIGTWTLLGRHIGGNSGIEFFICQNPDGVSTTVSGLGLNHNNFELYELSNSDKSYVPSASFQYQNGAYFSGAATQTRTYTPEEAGDFVLSAMGTNNFQSPSDSGVPAGSWAEDVTAFAAHIVSAGTSQVSFTWHSTSASDVTSGLIRVQGSASAWPDGLSLVGPTGATGATGPTGATGAQGATGVGMLTFETPGVLTTATGVKRLYNDTGRSLTMTKVRASLGTPPSGTFTIDVKRNGTSVFTVPGVTVPAAAVTTTKNPDASGTSPQIVQIAKNAAFTNPPAASSVIVVVCGNFNSNATPTATVSGCGASWSQVIKQSPGAANYRVGWVFVGLTPDGVNKTLTVQDNYSGNINFVAYELSGVISEVPTAGHFGGSTGTLVTSLAPPAMTPTQVGDIIINCLVEANNSVSGITSGWTDDGVDLSWAHAAHLIATDTSPHAATFSWSGGVYSVATSVLIRAAPTTAPLNDGDYLTVDVTAADGTASDLTVQVTLS